MIEIKMGADTTKSRFIHYYAQDYKQLSRTNNKKLCLFPINLGLIPKSIRVIAKQLDYKNQEPTQISSLFDSFISTGS